MKHKLLFLVVALLMTAQVYAQTDGGTIGTITWNYDTTTKTLTIEDTGDTPDWGSSSNLPPWNVYQTTIETVVIGSDITSIGNYAFFGCSSLADIDLSKVTDIGDGAFWNCTGLRSITLSANVPKTGNVVFYGVILANVDLIVPAPRAHTRHTLLGNSSLSPIPTRKALALPGM